MSYGEFVGGVFGGVIISMTDQRAGDEYFYDNEDLVQPSVLLSFDWRAVIEAAGFVSPWWPAHGTLIGGWGFDGDGLVELGAKHADMWRSFGANGRLAFVGYTRDAYGSPLGSCTVRCFRSDTDEMVSRVTSDATGFYQATTPYGGVNHYLVVHGPGGTVAGATIDSVRAA